MICVKDISDGENTYSVADEMIAPVETGASATRKYEVGQQFRHRNDGKLYKAKVTINIGDSFVVNTNCEEAPNVTDQIAGLGSSDITTGEEVKVGMYDEDELFKTVDEINIADSSGRVITNRTIATQVKDVKDYSITAVMDGEVSKPAHTLSLTGDNLKLSMTVNPTNYPVNIHGFYYYTKKTVTPATWYDATPTQVKAMLENHYSGQLDIYDYWNVGETRWVTLAADSNSKQPAQEVGLTLVDATTPLLTTPIGNHTRGAFVVAISPLEEPMTMDVAHADLDTLADSQLRSWLNTYMLTMFSNSSANALLADIFKSWGNQYYNLDTSQYDSVSDLFALPHKLTSNKIYLLPTDEMDFFTITSETVVDIFDYFTPFYNQHRNEIWTKHFANQSDLPNIGSILLDPDPTTYPDPEDIDAWYESEEASAYTNFKYVMPIGVI